MKVAKPTNKPDALDREEIIQRAEVIVNGMMGLSMNDAVAILSTGIYIIATGHDRAKDILEKSCYGFNPNVRRVRPGGISLIDKNPEVKAYIHGIDRYLSVESLHRELVKRFGKERAPSKSSIGRYLQKISKANCQHQEGNE